MDRIADIVIIGAGSAGLSAFKEASKFTKNILLIDKGPLGTTCARVGCMPSKALIQVANDFYSRRFFKTQGIEGAERLTINIPDALQHVRTIRDQFTAGVINYTLSLKSQYICGEARFVSSTIIKVNNQTIRAKAIIIATGSRSVMPEEWLPFKDKLLTSETIFEQTSLANKIAVIGAGSIGLEFSQALARLGVTVSNYQHAPFIGGLSDPDVNDIALHILNQEFPIHLNEEVSLSEGPYGLCVNGSNRFSAGQVLVAVGRQPNLHGLGLNELGISFDKSGIPLYDKKTMQIKGFPIYLTGDVNKTRPLLHEAADEGRIAGFNAANLNNSQAFKRRTPIGILFSDPNIAVIGRAYKTLKPGGFVIGEIDYSKQGRAKLMHANKGLLRIYGSKKTGKLLGAELIAPGGEHFAHYLALAIQKGMKAADLLKMPFYHPVLEEGLRTALRDLTKQTTLLAKPSELAMCDSDAFDSLC